MPILQRGQEAEFRLTSAGYVSIDATGGGIAEIAIPAGLPGGPLRRVAGQASTFPDLPAGTALTVSCVQGVIGYAVDTAAPSPGGSGAVTASSLADTLEGAATTDPASLARIQASVSGAYVVTPDTVIFSGVGDSIVRNTYSPQTSGGPAGTSRRWTGFGAWPMWAAFYSGGRFWSDPYALEGYSGNRTHQIYALLQSATATEEWGSVGASETIPVGLRARTCHIVADMSGTNDMLYAPAADITDGSALQRAIAGRKAIWAYLRAIGKAPCALSLLPREGSVTGGAGTMTQDQLKPYVPAWNAAMKSAADADGVPWIDGYSVCANGTGGWKTGYVYHNGADDPTYLHPSLLASMEIGKVAARVVNSMIKSAPAIPRVLKGSSEIYAVPFEAGNPRTYYDNFDTGLFPSATGWGLNFDPQADSTLTLVTPTQDQSGGGTLRLRKPARNTTAYCSYLGPVKDVAAGQERLFVFDMRVVSCDGFSSYSVKIVDRTSGSTSINQPIAALDISGKEVPPLTTFDTGVGRFVLYYKVPANVTRIACMLEINRQAGGASTGNDDLYVSNMVQIRKS